MQSIPLASDAAPHEARAPHRIAMLDVWRFVSIFIVILSHLVHHPYWDSRLSENAQYAFIVAGRVGVFCFFFISGYVVTKTALKEVRDTHAFSVKAFYVRRVFRIFPPLTIYLLACWLLGSMGAIDFGSRQFVSASFYLCNTNFPLSSCGWFVGHTWSLAYEEQFYLVFPFLLLFLELGRKPRVQLLVPALAIALLPVIFPSDGFSLTVRAHALFLMGYLCARYEKPIFDFIRGKTWLLLPISMVLVFFPFTLFFDPHAGWYRLMGLVAIPVMIVCSLLLPDHVKNIFCRRWVVYMGQISYSFYLWQQLTTSSVFFDQPPWVAPLMTALLAPFCALMFEKFEKPLIQMGRRISTAARAQAAPT